MKIFKAADYKRMPWKNGGGETAEIAVFPKDASLADFEWRISIATVASDGPFSSFAEIDRTLTILSGEGMELEIAGERLALTHASQPHHFPADVATSARLLGGTVVDLNGTSPPSVPSQRVLNQPCSLSKSMFSPRTCQGVRGWALPTRAIRTCATQTETNKSRLAI